MPDPLRFRMAAAKISPGNTHDYNGPGEWSADQVVHRYQCICRALGKDPRAIKPGIHKEKGVTRIFPVMDSVIEAANDGDLSALELCLQLIEVDNSMPFGMILKSRAARALKRNAAVLTRSQRSRIENRVSDMIARDYRPREFQEYVKLERRLTQATE